MLVILDNAATASQVRPLLPGAATCLVVVTSRSRLSGLVARDGAFRLSLDILPEEDAVALLATLVARYRKLDQRHELVELARLCARLPLALRIAAERAASRPMMRLVELIADLRDESALWDALTAEGDDDADAVRTVFAWSYRALPEPAARLFRLLGLHPGSEFGLPAAAALAGISTLHARQQLDVLVGAHLLEQPAPGRYEFHDLLRAYAVDQVRHSNPPRLAPSHRNEFSAGNLHTADAAQTRIAPLTGTADRADPGRPRPARFRQLRNRTRWYQVGKGEPRRGDPAAAETNSHATAWRLAAVLRAIFMHRTPSTTGSPPATSESTRLGGRRSRWPGRSPGNLGRAYFQDRVGSRKRRPATGRRWQSAEARRPVR